MKSKFHFRLKSRREIVGAIVVCCAAVAFSANAANLLAQDAGEENASAAAENPAPAEQTTTAENPASAENSTPTEQAAPTPAPNADFLALERAAREKSPELFAKLTVVREFSKRLPNFWRALRLTKKQTNSIYAVQKDYFDEISKLEARIKRLEDERDEKMRAVLTEKQRAALDAKLAEAEKKRADRAAAKEAEEEARAEAEIAE